MTDYYANIWKLKWNIWHLAFRELKQVKSTLGNLAVCPRGDVNPNCPCNDQRLPLKGLSESFHCSNKTRRWLLSILSWKVCRQRWPLYDSNICGKTFLIVLLRTTHGCSRSTVSISVLIPEIYVLIYCMLILYVTFYPGIFHFVLMWGRCVIIIMTLYKWAMPTTNNVHVRAAQFKKQNAKSYFEGIKIV